MRWRCGRCEGPAGLRLAVRPAAMLDDGGDVLGGDAVPVVVDVHLPIRGRECGLLRRWERLSGSSRARGQGFGAGRARVAGPVHPPRDVSHQGYGREAADDRQRDQHRMWSGRFLLGDGTALRTPSVPVGMDWPPRSGSVQIAQFGAAPGRAAAWSAAQNWAGYLRLADEWQSLRVIRSRIGRLPVAEPVGSGACPLREGGSSAR